jgi:hypothetical protein
MECPCESKNTERPSELKACHRAIKTLSIDVSKRMLTYADVCDLFFFLRRDCITLT